MCVCVIYTLKVVYVLYVRTYVHMYVCMDGCMTHVSVWMDA